MTECPLCNSVYDNDTVGDELFFLHLTNLHGMDDGNAQDILGRSMESNIWDISNATEVDFETMHKAEQWWDNKFVQYGSKPWADQNIAERRTTINAYLRRKQNAWGEVAEEAEYQGKQVTLNKPVRGGSKKFYVYVRDPKTKNIKKVSFGDTTGLSIKRDDPERRKAFRSRHNCADKKDITTAGYWSCKMWEKNKSVDDVLSGEAEDPCWDGYMQIGMKEKNGKQVPNCVPKSGEGYGFSKSEWDNFSDDTKRSLAQQLGPDDVPELDINLSEYSSGSDPTEKPLTYGTNDGTPHMTHDLRQTDAGVYCKTCGQLIYGTGDESNAVGNYKDEIDQLQSEERMCESCMNSVLESLSQD